MAYVYLFEVTDTQGTFYKIGISSSPESRFQAINRTFEGNVKMRFKWRCGSELVHARAVESFLHEMLTDCRTHAVVGMGSGSTEWFALSDAELKYLIAFCSILELGISSEDQNALLLTTLAAAARFAIRTQPHFSRLSEMLLNTEKVSLKAFV